MTDPERTLLLAAFASASTTQRSVGAWTHPRTDPGILDPDYYIDLARTLDRGGFDLLFFDDRLAMPAAYRHSIRDAAERGSRSVKLDLLPILAMVASHTTRIGLGATYSTTYHNPYHVARTFATLDHLSRGRAVWNIVTSLNDEEAANFGVEGTLHGDRYDRADEFLEVVTGLWETWESDAVEMDRSTGRFADPDKVHQLDYRGKYHSSRGPLTVPQPPQGWPTLLQAGQSGRGIEFAGRWADITFISPGSLENAQRHHQEQTAALAAQGRARSDIRILPAVQPIVAETEEMAREKERFFNAMTDPDEELIFLSEQANFDFSRLPLDEPLTDELLDEVTGAKGLLMRHVATTREIHGPDATLRDLSVVKAQRAITRFVGSPGQVADQMEEWFETAVDGFVVLPTDAPGSYEDVARLVVPELRRRGLVPAASEGGTFRDRLGLPRRNSR